MYLFGNGYHLPPIISSVMQFCVKVVTVSTFSYLATAPTVGIDGTKQAWGT